MLNQVNVDHIVDYYVENFSPELSLNLLKILAYPSEGGLGYQLTTFNPSVEIDGWEVNHVQKMINLDTHGIYSKYSAKDIATHLKHAIETEFLKTRSSLLAQVGWGTGKVFAGLIETAVGVVGILVPEPSTTAIGVGMVVLGTNTLGDGFSQLFGANQGNGYNLLGEAFSQVGAAGADLAGLDKTVGQNVGKGIFLISSLALGSIGSIRVLNISSNAPIRFGAAGRTGGVQIGRIMGGYSSERAADGMTIININNNTGQSILRFVTHNGQLVVNGRIVGVQKVLKHESDPKMIMKGLLKLLAHGAKY